MASTFYDSVMIHSDFGNIHTHTTELVIRLNDYDWNTISIKIRLLQAQHNLKLRTPILMLDIQNWNKIGFDNNNFNLNILKLAINNNIIFNLGYNQKRPKLK